MHLLVAITASVSLLLAANRCAARTRLDGHWTGTVEHAHAVTALIVQIDSRLHARVSAPDSGLFDVPGTFRSNGAEVDGEIVRGSTTLRFRGRNAGDVIDGDARAGTFLAHVHLHREGDVQPPLFTEVETVVAGSSSPLRATLLQPVNVGRPPAVVLMHGSHGPSRKDLRGPATLFARHGIAALIYDKRDLGEEQDGPHHYSFQELADDARAAVRLLRRRGDIDPARVGVFGMSEGGWIAPLVAADNPEIAFVIAISAPAVSYAIVEDVIARAQLCRERANESDVIRALQLMHRTNDYVRRGGDPKALTADLQAASRLPWARRIALPRHAPTAEEIGTDVRWRELDYDPAAAWARVRAPVFAAWGEDDDHPVAASLAAMRAAFTLGGNRNVVLRMYTRATHELLESEHAAAWQWPRLKPHFIADMLTWTSSQTSAAMPERSPGL